MQIVGEAATGLSPEGQIYSFMAGAFLCIWTLDRLRRRALLNSICMALLSIGVGLVLFSLFPWSFDAVARLMGVKYPPLLYLSAVCLCLLGIVLHLANRISAIDIRCRRLTQEVALLSHNADQRELAGEVEVRR